MAAGAPTVDELLGAPSVDELLGPAPTVDELLGPVAKVVPSGPSLTERVVAGWKEFKGDVQEAGQIISRGNAAIPTIPIKTVTAEDLGGGPMAQRVAGIQQGAADLLKGILNPVGAAAIGTSVLVPPLAAPIAAAFLAQTAASVPEQATRAGTAFGSGQTEQGYREAVGLGGSMVIAPALGLGIKATAPLTARALGLTKDTFQPGVQSAIIPGAKEFIEQDVIPKFQEAAKGVAQTADEIGNALRPANKSDISQETAGIVRHRAGELAQKDVQSRAALDQARVLFDKSSEPANLDFINKMETGAAQPTPELTSISTKLRDAFNERVAEVRALGTGKLQNLIQDYFPHIWEDPAAARNVYADTFSKKPLEGSKAFLKQRTIPTIADGIAAGLKPVSTNPVELTLLKLHEMDRYIMAHKVLNEMKDAGLAKFVKATDKAPDGYTPIDDRIANVYEGVTDQGSLAKRGQYHAPNDAARLINNYLSPGLRRFALFRGALAASNTLNQFQLGLSGYHLRFTTIDSAVSKLALALEQATRSPDASQGLKAAQSGLSGTAGAVVGQPAVNNFLRGTKVLKEYTRPGTQGGDLAAVVDALVKGGGRVKMDSYYSNSALESFVKAMKAGNYPGAVLRAPFAAVHAVSKPIMEIVVPTMKLGIFADLARLEMEKNPGMTLAQQRLAFGKIWDSVDNRMGQLVYDNLFWDKTLKDALMLGTRSLGWNLGTIRELGGAVKDTATMRGRVAGGGQAMTHRMAYAFALPVVVATIGAMYQYMHTGSGPQELKDYFLPKTGETLPDGSPERVMMPTYVKDILPLAKAGSDFGVAGVASRGGQMVLNKTGPLLNMFSQMAQNKDFFGVEIANKNDPLVQEAIDEARFVIAQFEPFTMRGAVQRENPGVQSAYESFTGVMPAAKELTRTKAMTLISEYNAKFAGSKTKTEAEKLQIKRDLRSGIRKGEDVSTELQDMMQNGTLTRAQVQRLIKDARTDPRIASFAALPKDIALNVFEAATDEEKALWKNMMAAKMRRK